MWRKEYSFIGVAGWLGASFGAFLNLGFYDKRWRPRNRHSTMIMPARAQMNCCSRA